MHSGYAYIQPKWTQAGKTFIDFLLNQMGIIPLNNVPKQQQKAQAQKNKEIITSYIKHINP